MDERENGSLRVTKGFFNPLYFFNSSRALSIPEVRELRNFSTLKYALTGKQETLINSLSLELIPTSEFLATFANFERGDVPILYTRHDL